MIDADDREVLMNLVLVAIGIVFAVVAMAFIGGLALKTFEFARGL